MYKLTLIQNKKMPFKTLSKIIVVIYGLWFKNIDILAYLQAL